MKRPVLILLFAVLPVSAQIRSDFARKMNEPVEPFKIVDNIYYVGAADIAVYLITTEKGHILIDAGFAETVPQIEANIETLGFKLTDIKILLNNHAHSDHAGGLALMKEKTGAKLYASKKQAKQLKRGGKKDFAFADKLSFAPVESDRRVRNGGRIRFGGVTLLAHFTPGHTKGCTTFTTTAKHGDGLYQVIFLCSTTALDYDLVSNKKYGRIAKDFASTFDFLRSLKVDIFLASHASFFRMKTKIEALKTNPNANPFVDPKGYWSFVARTEKAFLDKLAKQKNDQNNSQ